MRYVERFAGFWYDFVVGDDWVAAAGVVLALAATAALAGAAPVWWLMPLAVVLLLAASVWRGARAAGQAG
jgi:hypothetical protein